MNPHYHRLSSLVFSLLLHLGLTFFAFPAFSQLTIEWNNTYGSDGWEEFNAMTLTSDSSYLFAGVTTAQNPFGEVSEISRGGVDFWLLKADIHGEKIWDKRLGGLEIDRAWTVLETSDGGYLVGGESSSSDTEDSDRTAFNRGGLDYWVVKLDALGNVEWDQAYGGAGEDILRVIVPVADGFLLAGRSNSDVLYEKSENSRGSMDYWIVKIDNAGNKIWDRTFGGDGLEELYDAEPTPDGGILLAGSTVSGIGGDKTQPMYGVNDTWLLKLNSTGSLQWQLDIGGDGEDVPLDLYHCLDGSWLVLGHSGSSKGSGNKSADHFGASDAWLVRFFDNPTFAMPDWQKSFGGLAGDFAYAAAQTNSGKFMVIGTSYSQDMVTSNAGNKQDSLLGQNDYWVLFLENNGDKIWDESVGGIGQESGTKILRAHKNGFIFGGHSMSTATPPYKDDPSRGWNDMYVVKTSCFLEASGLLAPPKICRDEQVEVNATLPGCPDCIYLWDDGSEDAERVFSPDSTSMFHLTISDNEAGCDVRDSVLVEVAPVPEGLLSDQKDASCYGRADGEFYLDEVLGGTPPYLYSFNGGDWAEVPHYAFLPAGQYDFQVLDANGCLLDTTFLIEQPEEVLVELGDDIFLQLGDSVQLQALTNLLDSFHVEWLQPQFLSCPDCLEPWASPTYTTPVHIRLTDWDGCEARDFLHIIIKQSDAVFIPNVFSPNLDNINDFFTVYADESILKVNSLLIFDRWGEKMFELHDFPPNVEQLGWDGNLDGKPMKPAVFVYWTEVEYVDGRKKFFEGSVTLMRL